MAETDFIKVGNAADDIALVENSITNKQLKITLTKANGETIQSEPVLLPSPEISELAVASPTVLGGVKPVAKTAEMTQSVGIDTNGALFTKPAPESGGGGGSAKYYKHYVSVTISGNAWTFTIICDTNEKINTATLLYRYLRNGIVLKFEVGGYLKLPTRTAIPLAYYRDDGASSFYILYYFFDTASSAQLNYAQISDSSGIDDYSIAEAW